MKTAITRAGVLLPKNPVPEIWGGLAPERRYIRGWVKRARTWKVKFHYVFVRRAAPLREIAPGARPLPEHEWRPFVAVGREICL